jgi:hypothetical protein
MKEERQNPNPKGKEGKPFTLEPMSFEDAVKRMLSTPPPKSEQKAKPEKKPAKSKQ